MHGTNCYWMYQIAPVIVLVHYCEHVWNNYSVFTQTYRFLFFYGIRLRLVSIVSFISRAFCTYCHEISAGCSNINCPASCNMHQTCESNWRLTLLVLTIMQFLLCCWNVFFFKSWQGMHGTRPWRWTIPTLESLLRSLPRYPVAESPVWLKTRRPLFFTVR